MRFGPGAWVFLLASALPAAAQTPGTVSISAGVVTTSQSGVVDQEFQVYTGSPGGVTTSWAAGVDIALPRGLALGIGVTPTGLMTSRQPSRYGMTFNEDRRDLFVDAFVHGHVRAARSFALEPLAGVTVAHRRHWSQTEYRKYYLLPEEQILVGPRVEGTSLTSVGALVGLQLAIGTARFAVVPSVTGRLVVQEEYSGWYPEPGPTRFSASVGVVARVGLGTAASASPAHQP